MKVGIVGKPLSGKTTLFQALCKGQGQTAHTREPVHAVVVVPDPRFDFFVDVYKPKKISPASIDFVDDIIRISDEKSGQFSDEAMGELRTADAITYIINAFNDSEPDPDDIRQEALGFIEELGLRDLMLVEGRLERIQKQTKGPQATASLKVEQGALEKIHKALEAGQRLDQVDLEDNETKAVAGFQLLSYKPLVMAINVSEDALPDADSRLSDIISALREMDIEAFCLSAELERQVAELPAEEQSVFLEEIGATDPVRDRLIRAIYTSCNLITFFTISEKEVHAWPLEAGSTALEAADSIHSDLARGFIRAEVISWDDISQAGDWDKAKADGKLKLVGKEHVVHDGDSLYIRFKV